MRTLFNLTPTTRTRLTRTSLTRTGWLLAAAALTVSLSACASETPAPDDIPGIGSEAPAEAETDAAGDAGTGADTDAAGGDGEYAFGTDRDQIAQAIEQAFGSQGGSAAWEGDTLVLTVDGDADSTMAGFSQCMVLAEILNEGDIPVVEFPNGRINCVDVLP